MSQPRIYKSNTYAYFKVLKMKHKTMRYLLGCLILLPLTIFAQEALINEVNRPIVTYPFSDPDPVARPGRVYPYFRFDVFTNHSVIQEWKMVELENDYIRLAVMPDQGGKVWEAYEKSKNFPFIYSAHSVKFRDLALRGPWTSDGIEFNFGDIGHATTTATPVDYYTRTNPDGSVSCFIGATDWASRTTWHVEINLAPDKAYFSTRLWWNNGTPVEQEMYHWTNAAFPAPGNLEFIFPGSQYIGHRGEFDTWPIDSAGREISFYEHNNFGSMKSYHVLGRPTNFYGGFWHDYNMGFGHYTPYYEKPGKKIWIWGLSREGLIWEKLLTDTDGPYVELQSGRLFNQASRGSELTPFKHEGFAPYSTEAANELWFPVKHTRGLTNASERGALNLRLEDNWLKIDWMALENQLDTMMILASGSIILKRIVNLEPMELFRDSVKWSGSIGQIVVKLGKDVLTDDPGKELSRPLSSPDNFDWNSEYGLLLMGTDLSMQKNYQEAEEYLMRALGKNPNLVPALSKMAEIRYRQGLFLDAMKFAGKALAVNTYDPQANYFWGLANERLGQDADALDGFSVAALSAEFRHAALLRIAYLAMKRKDWEEAGNVINKCVNNYPPDENSWIVKAITERKLGNQEEALNIINEQLDINPLNHAARFEKYLNTKDPADQNEFVSLIRQEWPHETYIEMAIRYYDWNMEEEAHILLDLAPEHPMVQLWQAWLLKKEGKDQEAKEILIQANTASPALIFPFRPEMNELFSWAYTVMPGWKWLYYEALTCWQFNQPERARELFIKCGDDPDFAPFYLTKSRLFEDDYQVFKASVERAYALDPDSWRMGMNMVNLYIKENQVGKALQIAKRNFKLHSDKCMVVLQYANVLKLNERYSETLKILSQFEMLPAESDKFSGDVNAHKLFRETNILCAINEIKSEKWEKALAFLHEAETWPEHLGWGEPYLPDNRLTQFLSAYCYDKLKLKDQADASYRYILEYTNPYDWETSLGNKLSDLVNAGERDFKKITAFLIKSQDKNSELELLRIFMKSI
jgi:tetratricopeptide (TPR) repeat protein